MSFLLKGMKGGLDTVTGKKKLDAEKGEHDKTVKQLDEAKEDLAELTVEKTKLSEQVEHLEMELGNERAMRMEAQRDLQAKVDAEEDLKAAADREAKSKQEAEEELLKAGESAKKQALLDAQKAYEAMSGLMTDELKLSEAICLQSYAQNQILRQVYISNYGKDLYMRVKSKTSGNLRGLLLGVLDGPLAFMVETLYNAMSGLGTNYQQLTSIICASDDSEIEAMKAKYKELYNKDLIERVTKATSGDIQKILIAVLQASRSKDTNVDAAQVNADANALYAAGQGKTLGHDIMPFISILTQRSAAHIKALNKAYKTTNRKEYDLVTAISKVFGGDECDAFMSMVSYQMDPATHYYYYAENAMKGIGCDSVALIYMLIRRREIDMGQIKKMYEEAEHKRPMVDRVKEELGGDVGKAAVMLIQ
jgi:hypothetical protein